MALTVSVQELVARSKNPLLATRPHWSRVRLGDVAQVLNGFAFKSSQFSRDEGVPLIRIRDVGSNGSDTKYIGEYEDRYLVRAGDLLVGMDGDFNCARWRAAPGLLNQRVCKVSVDPHCYEPRLLDYVLPAYLSAINDATSSVTVKHLSSRSIEDIPLPLPPMDEQRRIVAEIEKQFSRLDEAVANLQRVKANLKRYEAAVLNVAVQGRLVPTEALVARSAALDFEPATVLLAQMLSKRRAQWSGRGVYQEPGSPDSSHLPLLPDGWAWASIEQVASGERYALSIGPFGSSLKVSDYESSGVPLVFVRNIRARNFRDEDAVFVSPEKAAELRAHWVAGGDLLITKMGAPPGDVCVYPPHRPAAVITADCIKLRPSTILPSAKYLEIAIAADVVQKQIAGITQGVAQQKISLGRFSTIAVPLPPLVEQHRIVAEVDRRLSIIREVEAEVDANLKRAQSLRQSVLQAAFACKLPA